MACRLVGAKPLIGTNAVILSIGPLGTNFSEILIKIITFSFKKMRLKVSSGKRRPSCLGLNVLTRWLILFTILIAVLCSFMIQTEIETSCLIRNDVSAWFSLYIPSIDVWCCYNVIHIDNWAGYSDLSKLLALIYIDQEVTYITLITITRVFLCTIPSTASIVDSNIST